jgi:hypothetical protein
MLGLLAFFVLNEYAGGTLTASAEVHESRPSSWRCGFLHS